MEIHSNNKYHIIINVVYNTCMEIHRNSRYHIIIDVVNNNSTRIPLIEYIILKSLVKNDKTLR